MISVDRLNLLADALGRHLGCSIDATELISRAPTVRSARFLRALDGWIVANLARPADTDSIPAWIGDTDDVAETVSTLLRHDLVAQGRLLGLAVASVGEAVYVPPPVRMTRRSGDCQSGGERGLAIDLSAMWAGPLCGKLLADAGWDVVKVETPDRPDGMRFGDPELFQFLNRDKRSATMVLGDPELARLVDRADVVIEGSRPRALAHVGLGPERCAAGIWLSITAYGREHPDRIGFGDDAAAAAGLVEWVDGEPSFVGDAIADPTTGMLAALAVVSAHRCGGRWLLDAALARSAGWLMC